MKMEDKLLHPLFDIRWCIPHLYCNLTLQIPELHCPSAHSVHPVTNTICGYLLQTINSFVTPFVYKLIKMILIQLFIQPSINAHIHSEKHTIENSPLGTLKPGFIWF